MMGAEDKDTSAMDTIAEQAKGVAVEAYKDVGKPVLAPVGRVAGGFVKLVLWPVKLALDSANAKLDQLSSRVEAKLKAKGVPPERQLPAPATVAGPAALHYALLGDGDEVSELRDMFENLLATSMDADADEHAHPAFVGMISQMTPDEARILKSITQSRYAAYNLFDRNRDGEVGHELGFRSLLGVDVGAKQPLLQQYISNLERLGVLRIDWAEDVVPTAEWYMLGPRIEAEFPGANLVMNRGIISVTALGQQFIDTCVRPKR